MKRCTHLAFHPIYLHEMEQSWARMYYTCAVSLYADRARCAGNANAMISTFKWDASRLGWT